MGETVPTALFSSTDQYEVELCSFANEVAEMIAKLHDWRKLTTLKTQAGDGTTTAFSLPTDYDRMPVKAAIFKTSAQLPLTPVQDLDVWQDIQLRSWTGGIGWWIILGGSLNIQPVLSASDSAKYYYQSNLIVDPATGDNKTSFTLDTDTFRLPERLLKLGVCWFWRAQKGLDSTQERTNFELALTQEIARDKGSRIIKLGRGRVSSDIPLAYPGSIEV